MFKWLNTNKNHLQHDNAANSQNTNRVLSLTEPPLKICVHKIQQLCGVTQSDFAKLYVMTLERWCDYMSEPNQSQQNTSMAVDILEKVVLALRRRQGYLLPRGADSETSFREREEWTFAVFSAALFHNLDHQVRTTLAKALLPKQGYDWLARNNHLFDEWLRFLDGVYEKNIFAVMTSQASVLTKNTVAEESQSIDESTADDDGFHSENESSQVATADQTSTVVQSDQVNDSSKHNNEVEAKHCNNHHEEVPSVPTKAESTVTLKDAVVKVVDLDKVNKKEKEVLKDENDVEAINQASSQEIPQFDSNTFWQWLEHVLSEKTITINQSDSVIQGVELGVLILIPNAIDAFIQDEAKKRDFSAGHAIWQQRPKLIKKIKKHENLIKNHNGAYIHEYYWGDWHDRQTFSGLVMNASDLLNGTQTIPVNPELSVELMH